MLASFNLVMPLPNPILFGTSGFQYPDWKGIVYPADVKKRYGHELACIAEYFDCCEINTSFYGPLKPNSAKNWCDYVAAVNPDFQFTAKLTQTFTHAPDAKKTSSSVETIKYTQKDVDEARAGFAPLMEADRMGAVIAQFPISFKFKKAGRITSIIRTWALNVQCLLVRHTDNNFFPKRFED